MELNEEKAKSLMKGRNWGIKALIAIIAGGWLIIELLLTSGCAATHTIGVSIKSTPTRDTMAILIKEVGKFKK